MTQRQNYIQRQTDRATDRQTEEIDQDKININFNEKEFKIENN